MSQSFWTCMALLALTGGGWMTGAKAQTRGDAYQHRPPRVDPSVEVTKPPIYPMGTIFDIDDAARVGDKAPDFALQNSQGQWVHLSDLEGHWAIMLFTKDRRALPPFKGIDRELRNLGARLFCVSTDGTSALKAHAVREQIPFVLLSDPTGQVSQLYGMYDSGERAIEPGIVVLDPRGVVRMKQIDQTLQPDGVLQVVERILGER